MVPQTVTASPAIPLYSLVTITKEIIQAKQTKFQVRKNVQEIPPKQSSTLQPTTMEPITALKIVTRKTAIMGKKTE